jgi:DNA-directed RNA polymerase specialized sigma24 family protein
MSPRLNKKEEAMQEKMSTAYVDYAKDLNKHSFFKVHDLALSQDLVQDTFSKTWSYLVKGGEIDLMRAFLYHTLNCLIIDEYRKKKPASLDALVEQGFEPHSIDTASGKVSEDYPYALCTKPHLGGNGTHYGTVKKCDGGTGAPRIGETEDSL